jgi:hypothetical protein
VKTETKILNLLAGKVEHTHDHYDG